MESETKEGAPPGGGFLHVVNILSNMFGQVMDNDVICAVAESCDGDIQHSIEALMQITKESEETLKQQAHENHPDLNPSVPTIITTSWDVQEEPANILATPDTAEPIVTTSSQVPTTTVPIAPPQSEPQSTINYANASKATGVIPKKRNLPLNTSEPYKPLGADRKWIEQLTRIIERYHEGYRILVLMRGPPGCGKSFLSRKIIDATVGGDEQTYRSHIQSTDDFFVVRGKYIYARERLSEAHTWNQNRVHKSLINGMSPVIVDNTNIEVWELHPYVKFGVREGYYIEIIDPISPWARNAYQLFKRNSHNVPLDKIRKMLNNFQGNVSAESIINYLGVSYQHGKVPPVKRYIPEFYREEIPSITVTQVGEKDNFSANSKSVSPPSKYNIEISSGSVKMLVCKDPQLQCSTVTSESKAPPIPARQDLASICSRQGTNIKKESNISKENLSTSSHCEIVTHENDNMLKNYNEVEKKLKEFDELDAQWEMGDVWEDTAPESNSDKAILNPTANPFKPKPAPLHIQPSTSNIGQSKEQETPKIVKKKVLPESSGCVEWKDITRFIADWNPEASSTRQTSEKLPVEKISSSTSIEIGDVDNIMKSKYKVVTGTPRDINFYYMPREERIPDKRMLDKSSMTHEPQLITIDNYRCKNEEKHFSAFRKMFKNIPKEDLRHIFDNCCGDVNWAVEIVIDGVASNAFETVEEDMSDSEDFSSEQCECVAAYNIIPNDCRQNLEIAMATEQTESVPTPKKVKKEKGVTDSMKELKKRIEENVVIADNHYSQHCLKIRKMRRGESDQGEATNTPATSPNPRPGTSKEPPTSLVPDYHCSDNESESSQEPEEQTITMNVGCEFVNRLDEYFNRQGTSYPSNIVPFINMPISTLNELNALWIESLTNQIESQAAYSDILMKEDEEFARQLSAKEAELEQEGVEPEVPDFKEIMDMDFAQSLYQKGVNEWRNKEPNDIAARMSREKLFNLFPDYSPAVLSELLMAHNNNFQTTVEVMLMSTGRSEILEQKNGVNKFVMQKEMERQEKILAEEKKALTEEDWPILSRAEKVDMTMVDEYRREAQRHLEQRNIHHQKAQVYIQRGMTQCASYASEVAAFHRKKFEQANSRAATTLIQVNAGKLGENQVDLHFLFVAEALIALDIFLDFHIKKLRDDPTLERSKTLFIVTGRGLHSSGGARVKPAVRKRLRARKLQVGEKNPGLLTTVIRAESVLTDEWQPSTG